MSFVEELRALEQAATPGEWDHNYSGIWSEAEWDGEKETGYFSDNETWMVLSPWDRKPMALEDAQLIVFLRNHAAAIGELVEAAARLGWATNNALSHLGEFMETYPEAAEWRSDPLDSTAREAWSEARDRMLNVIAALSELNGEQSK